MIRPLLAVALIAAAMPALAEPLTVRPGETWLFTLDHGDPARPRKVEATTAPARGEMKVSVRALFGTMMTIINNSAQGYVFQAQLIGADGKAVNARSCGAPANNQPALESWPQKAAALRIGSFRPATGGRC
jgi:hypothetical protein